MFKSASVLSKLLKTNCISKNYKIKTSNVSYLASKTSLLQSNNNQPDYTNRKYSDNKKCCPPPPPSNKCKKDVPTLPPCEAKDPCPAECDPVIEDTVDCSPCEPDSPKTSTKDPCCKKEDPCPPECEPPADCATDCCPCDPESPPTPPVCCDKKPPCPPPCPDKDPCGKKDPCPPKDPCGQKDPCAPKDPCAMKDPCPPKDPCGSKDPCPPKDPCGKKDPCPKKDPCEVKDPCAKEPPCPPPPEPVCDLKPPCEKKDPCPPEDPCSAKKDPCPPKPPCDKKPGPPYWKPSDENIPTIQPKSTPQAASPQKPAGAGAGVSPPSDAGSGAKGGGGAGAGAGGSGGGGMKITMPPIKGGGSYDRTPGSDGMIKTPIGVYGIEGRYIAALYSAGYKKRNLEQIEQELSVFQEQLHSDPKLRDVMNDTSVKRYIKVEAFNNLAQKLGWTQEVNNFFQEIAENGRQKKVNNMINLFKNVMRAHRGEVHCKIITAKELNSNQLDRLNTVLKKFIKPNEMLDLKFQTDPSILGGMIVYIGDRYVNLSVAYKIRMYTELMRHAY
jgi:F-type H+-transporting ATPase subunit O